MGGFPQPVFSPDQIAAMRQQMQPASGYPSDTASPAAMPINSPTVPGTVDPGGTADLESRAAQAPQQLAQSLQAQQQPQTPAGQWSENNPYGKMAKDYQDQWQAAQPQPDQGGNVKRLLSNFFQGMGGSMMAEAGLTPPNIRRQQLQLAMMHATTLAADWEDKQGQARYRNALTDKMQQDADFERQMQPLRLQQEQPSLAAGQQNIPTVRPSMRAGDLAALGVPGDLAQQYAGKPLSEADMSAVKQMAFAGQKQLYDYGQDGQGQGKGIWLVDKQFNPIKQLSPISETSRSTNLARIQAQSQENLIKSGSAPVYAYDPNQRLTALTTMGEARQGGMQSIRGVKETDIRNDMHDTRVLNDVAVKSNNMLDSAGALDQNQNQRDIINWAMSQADNQLKVGAFGTTFPTGWLAR